jgi:predicted small metal-binding protein
MTKVIHCRDLGFDCDGVIRANSEEAALQMAAQHAKMVHGMDQVSPEVVEKLKSIIREDSASK